MRVGTLVAAIFIILVVIYLIWQLINSSMAGNARQNRKKRRSDRVRLGRAERKSYQQAHQLYREGNFKSSAKILESLGLLRESINILEKAGLYREAADALLRIQRPNRAGHLLARNGLWKEALEAYKKANMPLEIGRCYRELGDLSTAIPFFLEADAKQDAADCYVEVGKHQEGARLLLKLGNLDRALEQYLYLVDSSIDLEKLQFSEEELAFLVQKIVEGTGPTRLADILASEKKSGLLIIELIKTSNIKAATESYMRNTADIGPELISYSEFTQEQQLLLASLFINVSAYDYSGMVYERLGEFDKAGDAFEKGEYFERACTCFERANNKEKTTNMRIMIASGGSKVLKSPPVHSEVGLKNDEANPFSIQYTENQDLPEKQLSISKASKIPTLTRRLEESPEPRTENPVPLSPEGGNLDWSPFYEAKFMADLSLDERKQLQRICETGDFAKGEIILDYNQEPLGICIVLRGRINILKFDDFGKEHVIDFFEKGDTFGEFWLLMDQPTQFKFAASEACSLGWIRRADFENLMDKNGSIARKLYKSFSHTLITRLLNQQQKKQNKLVS